MSVFDSMIEGKWRWKLIYYLDTSSTVLFTEETVKYCENDGLKYSILGSLNENDKINGYFHFLIKYEYQNSDPTYLYWLQSVNPIETTPGQSSLGFIPLYVPSYPNPFIGLAKSTQTTKTYLDGTSDEEDTWWFSIGSYDHYTNGLTVPGANIGGKNNIGATKVYFYMQVLIMNKVSSSFKLSYCFSFLSLILILT